MSAIPRPQAENPRAEASAWAPLRAGIFRALWLASLVSLTGSWFVTVGAQWLLVDQPHASILVGLVQTATTIPFVFLGLPAGVLADTLDRRRLLVAAQAAMAAIGALLAVLTFSDQMPPALLLMLIFLLGSGAVLTIPAYQSLVPDLVARPQIPAAAALNSISINVARALGPAIAGVLIAQAGVGATFTVAAATSACFAIVVALWRSPPSGRANPEPFVAALRAGGRYVRHAPVVRRIMLRTALFLIPASSLFALLPLVGGLLFGALAEGIGLVETLLIAAGTAAVGASTIRIWPFVDVRGMDRSSVVYWPEPQLAADVDPAGRPVVVTVAYRVAPGDEARFLDGMARVRDSRLRTGAIKWGLYGEGEDSRSFVELFAVPSWEEHQRQHHERLTGTDREFQQSVMALSEQPPQVSHLISVEV